MLQNKENCHTMVMQIIFIVAQCTGCMRMKTCSPFMISETTFSGAVQNTGLSTSAVYVPQPEDPVIAILTPVGTTELHTTVVSHFSTCYQSIILCEVFITDIASHTQVFNSQITKGCGTFKWYERINCKNKQKEEQITLLLSIEFSSTQYCCQS